MRRYDRAQAVVIGETGSVHSLHTGTRLSIAPLLSDPRSVMLRQDTALSLCIEADQIGSLRPPATLSHYHRDPLRSMETSGQAPSTSWASRNIFGSRSPRPRAGSSTSPARTLRVRAVGDAATRFLRAATARDVFFIYYHRNGALRLRFTLSDCGCDARVCCHPTEPAHLAFSRPTHTLGVAWARVTISTLQTTPFAFAARVPGRGR
jgi:hypothetical protein